MVALKRQDGFYADLLSELLFDNPLATNVKSVSRDVQTLRERASKEGLSFLTKVLPRLGKALDSGLVNMSFSIPSGFKSAKDSCIPAFMQEYFKLVFHANGSVRHDADPSAVSHLRQVCFSCYKLEVPYQDAQKEAVIANFETTEIELHSFDGGFTGGEIDAAGYIIRDVFRDFDHKSIVPRHGPGAVATGESLDDKWHFARLYRGIHQVYPYYEYFVVGGARELIDRLGWYRSLKRLNEGVAKVVLVPKDSRGPRLISCEPLEFQWIQQGLGRKIVSHLESSRTTGGQVNFSDQEVNRQIALTSSRTMQYATLDLKDASDRVHLELVRVLFRHLPDLLRALEATRTQATTLPGGRIVRLAKYAPMGSALCFPVEAVCFWAICVAALARELRVPSAIAGKLVFVYGDDICVPTEHAELCAQALERYALKVNRSKSCASGLFRESCGMDAFNGVQVSPTRIRKLWNRRRTDATTYAAYVAYANDLSAKGYVSASDFLWKALRSVFGAIPYGLSDSPYPCRKVADAMVAHALNARRFVLRYNVELQRIEFLLPKLKVRKQTTTLDTWQRLLKSVVMPTSESDPSEVVVPHSTRIKWGWTGV